MDFSTLSRYTVAALRKLAKDKKLRGFSRLRKAELIEFIIKNTSGQADIEEQFENGENKKSQESEKVETTCSTCSICLENIKNTRKNTRKHKILKCKHAFHKACIDEWLRVSTTCPVCRNQEIEQVERRERQRTITLEIPELFCTCGFCLGRYLQNLLGLS